MKRKLLFLLLLLGNAAQSQTVIPRFETLGVDDGLSQSSVYSIYQDKQGFMWFGTADGLNRYDGHTVRVYKIDQLRIKKGNSNFIRGNIVEDRQGNIWYSNETGIYYYSPIADGIIAARLFTKEEGQLYVFELIGFDKAGILWLCNPVFGITSFNPVTSDLRMYPYPSFLQPDGAAYSEIELDDAGNIWFMVNLRLGICRFNIATKTYYPPTSATPIHRRVIRDSLIYTVSIDLATYSVPEVQIRNKNGLLKKAVQLNRIESREMTVIKMLVDYAGRLWITTTNAGLLMYDPSTEKLHQFGHDNSRQKSLPINHTRALFEDAQRNLWIGTDGGGVCKLDLKPPKFNLFPLNQGDHPFLKDYFIKCFFEDEERQIWFGTLSNGICKLNPETGELRTVGSASLKPGRFSTAVTGQIFRDAKGRIWAGSSMGIGIYNEGRDDFDPIRIRGQVKLSPLNIFVYQFQELQDGTMVVGTAAGLWHIVPTNNGYEAYLPKEQFMGITNVTGVRVMGNNIWYCSPINGLYQVQYRNGRFQLLNRLFTNTDLRSIAADEEDKQTIWVASGIGLIRLNTATTAYTIYNHTHGLRNSYIYGVLEDDQHQLWVSTNGGIAMFNKRTERFVNYTSKDGLQSNEFNTGAYYKSPAGTFYFGGIKGFNWFRPSDLRFTTTPPKAAISQVWINDQLLTNDSNYHFKKQIRVPHFKNDISLEIAALDFTRPEANKIQYRLKNWDNAAVITYNKQIRYSNLLPGDYRFEARVCNVDGVWSDPVFLNISIAAPFWNTWWFYTLLAVAAISLTLLIARYIYRNKLKQKIRDLEKQRALEEERKRISREMHDDIGAGLTQIALMSEVAKHSTANTKELEEIAGTSRQLMNSMSEIIWSLNPEYQSLQHLFAYLREQLNNLLEPSGLDYVIDFPEDVPEMVLSNDQRRNIVLITKEVVHNAVKHSKATTLTISASLDAEVLTMRITDNGIGLSSVQKATGNGLRNLQHRIHHLNASMVIDGMPGQGVKVVYQIPLKSHS